jgi:lipid A 3-O-deacylase
MRFWTSLAALVFFALLIVPAQAQIRFMPEVRGGLFARDIGTVWTDGVALSATPVANANIELLFNSNLSDWALLGELRPHLGATFGFSGEQTLAYAGLSWTVQIPIAPLFAEISAGGAVLAGDGTSPFALGADPACRIRFRASASLGWQFTPGTSLMLTGEHAPASPFCGTTTAQAQTGLTNVGVRLGVRF